MAEQDDEGQNLQESKSQWCTDENECDEPPEDVFRLMRNCDKIHVNLHDVVCLEMGLVLPDSISFLVAMLMFLNIESKKKIAIIICLQHLSNSEDKIVGHRQTILQDS